MAAEKILIVDDDEDVLLIVQTILDNAGYTAVLARNGREGVEKAIEAKPDLIILDVMMPELSGWEVCTTLKSAPETRQIPIAMLTVKSEIRDLITGMQVGADDYITKPFSVREFSSRVKAALRRAEMSRPMQPDPDEAPLEVLDLRIDFPKRTVRARGREVQLTFVEFEILSALARAPGRVFTRDMLLSRIWGDSAYRDPRTIDVHIRHLREKLEREPKDPEYLFTVRGVGYRFRDSDA